MYKSIMIGITAFVLFVGLFIFVFNHRDEELLLNQNKTFSVSESKYVKEYKNTTYGYKIQYPSYFSLDESSPDYVNFLNATCLSNDALCFPGVDGVSIRVYDNVNNVSISDKYREIKKNNSTCKKISIFSLPENFNKDELVNSIRCDILEVSKQSKGGYSYTTFHNDKIFEVIFSQGDSTIPAYIGDDLHDLSKDNYDPIGDIMMRTFRFIN